FSAFLGGELFDRGYLDEMTAQWRRMRAPVQYGLGMMRLTVPRWRAAPGVPREFIGHTGSTGSVLFQAPETGLFISGTLNSIGNASAQHRLLVKLAAAASGR